MMRETGVVRRCGEVKHITLTLGDVQRLADLYGGDTETEMSLAIVEKGQRSHSGPGVYAYYTDYPEEGGSLITEPVSDTR